MGFDLNGTTLTNSAGLVATNAGNQVMKMGPAGVLQRYNLGQPMFRAGGTTEGWSGVGTDQWAIPVWNLTDTNVGSCFSTVTQRFTVPVDGVYLVTAHSYVLINATGNYIHPMFWVNGSSNARRAAYGGMHRMRGHGIAGGYSVDGNLCEFIPLIAGDYVEYRLYCSGPVYHEMSHGRFEGYLLF